MKNAKRKHSSSGFTLMEIVVSILIVGLVLLGFAGIFALFQRGSTRTGEYSLAQQNCRITLDYITDHLRQAGSQTDNFRGQRPLVHAGPYQIVINADIDNGRTINGMSPLTAINLSTAPKTVPVSGTILYQPIEDYQSDAETIAFTIDSNNDGVISNSDRGDDPEESGLNENLFVLKMVTYGYGGGGSNEVRTSNIAIVRGPNLAPTWIVPQPLFQYHYDHDDNPSTSDKLWGDTNNNGELETSEITGLTPMPQSQLNKIRRVKITSISESNKYDTRYETNGGFMNITMTSEVYLRNMAIVSGMIRGMVFHDADKNGAIDPGETGIPYVEVRLAGQNRSVLTDNFGQFYIPLQAGDYSIQEIDPPDYSSTTSNLVSITLASGQTAVVNFGDISNAPIGVICGTVFDDEDKDGFRDFNESGIKNVSISLDDGSQALTGADGYYSFIARQGTYMVVETDPPDYSSTTPNSFQANIADANDTVTINFGDYFGFVSGTLEGYVYLDVNEDGIRNSREEGLPNTTILLSTGDSTMTNAAGLYRFNVEPGTYSITERDPVGYASTTVNKYVDIPIVADTTVIRNFGDKLKEGMEFVEIYISNSERVLSVRTTDLREDELSDQDIVVGTALHGELGNLLIFHNNWESAITPIGELFNSNPSYWRDAGDNINTINTYDFTRDGMPDILTGLDNSTLRNIQIWFTRDGGAPNMTPDVQYLATGLNEVMDSKPADLDLDGNIDLVVGLKSPIGSTGAFETYRGNGDGTFGHWQYIVTAGSEGEFFLSEIWAVEAGDVDGDGDADVIVGSHINTYYGYIDIYLNVGYASGDFVWHSRYRSIGAINDLLLVDMKEDDGGDPDIIAATSSHDNAGMVLLWSNTNGVFGMPDTTGYSFGPEVTANWPDDYVDGKGEVLSLAILNMNNDVFPDVAYGTRSSSTYTGNLYVLPTYGTLPVGGLIINHTLSGEIVSLDVTDFNKDGSPDIVAGTRNSATQGKLIAYFGRKQ